MELECGPFTAIMAMKLKLNLKGMRCTNQRWGEEQQEDGC
jgi:hypothetical protein